MVCALALADQARSGALTQPFGRAARLANSGLQCGVGVHSGHPAASEPAEAQWSHQNR